MYVFSLDNRKGNVGADGGIVLKRVFKKEGVTLYVDKIHPAQEGIQ